MNEFIEKFNKQVQKKSTLLCVGLDTDYEKLPVKSKNRIQSIWKFNKKVIDVTKEQVCCYKLNSAFYEVYGASGIEVLRNTVKYIGPDIPVILDAKRCDIGNTSKYYAQFAFDYIKADALTVVPYMGLDSLDPFFQYKEKYIFVVTLSSNPGSNDFQRSPFFNPLYLQVIKKINKRYNNAGYVFGATKPEYIKKIREKGIKNLLLIPGLGTQGGDARKSLMYATLNKGLALFNVSRGIIYSGKNKKYYQEIENTAIRYRKILKI